MYRHHDAAKPKAVITVDEAFARNSSLTLKDNVDEALKITRDENPEAARVEVVFVGSQTSVRGLTAKTTTPRVVNLEEVCIQY